MKKFRGFTLAEVLITLGIIGVIASVTLPSLSINIQKQQVGPALAKAVNTLESANAMLLQQTGARSLESICGTQYPKCLVDNNVLAATKVSSIPEYKSYSYGSWDSGGVDGYTTKDGITFYQEYDIIGKRDTAPSIYAGRFYSVTIDVNGPVKKPNALARDLFRFIVDMKGTVIASGSSLYTDYYQSNAGSWESTCNTKTVTMYGSTCSGSVVDNGYKIIYPY